MKAYRRARRENTKSVSQDEEGNGKQKSRDVFHRISRYYPSGGGDYGCPALSPRGGGFASSSSFSFSSFLVLALDMAGFPAAPVIGFECSLIDKVVSRAYSALKYRVSGVIQIIVSFFLQ